MEHHKQTSCAHSVFAVEIESFAASAKLSRRETDIVVALIRSITNSDEIAIHLGISTYTVNNHLKNIFEKTATNSKTEILSAFLRHSASSIKKRGLFIRKPRILIVDDEPLIGDYLVSGLQELGMQAFATTNPTQTVDLISLYNIDFVLCDIRMPEMSGLDVLKAVRKIYRSWPHLVFITGYPDHTLEESMDYGATGFIEKPLDFDTLFRKIMSHLTEDPNERLKILQINPTAALIIREVYKPQTHHIGFGGIFLQLDAAQQNALQIQVGSSIEIRFMLPHKTHVMPMLGQVVWQRIRQDGQKLPGIGIKMLGMPERDYLAFQDWVREHIITSFIPIGYVSWATQRDSKSTYEIGSAMQQ